MSNWKEIGLNFLDNHCGKIFIFGVILLTFSLSMMVNSAIILENEELKERDKVYESVYKTESTMKNVLHRLNSIEDKIEDLDSHVKAENEKN